MKGGLAGSALIDLEFCNDVGTVVQLLTSNVPEGPAQSIPVKRLTFTAEVNDK